MMRTIRTNLLAPFHTIQIFLPGMLTSRNGGTIVNVSSVLGQLTAAGLSDYATSKAGLSALHRSLEAELQESGLTEKVKLILVETGQMSTPLFEKIKTPNRFFAPVLEPIHVAYQVVSAIDNGKAGVLRSPAFAKLVNWYAVFPASIQKLARYLSGIDKAAGLEFISQSPDHHAAVSSESDSDMELVNVE
jgi:NAD(P)-dependent dehydrogenase (short-subunit alcohol dehydrogenase family)